MKTLDDLIDKEHDIELTDITLDDIHRKFYVTDTAVRTN